MRDLLISAFRASYRWGRDNCEGRSEKNANDFLETSIAKKCLDNVDALQNQKEMLLGALSLANQYNEFFEFEDINVINKAINIAKQ